MYLIAAASQPTGASATDSVRSCIPLRDSPGFPPGSLSRCANRSHRSIPQSSTTHRGKPTASRTLTGKGRAPSRYNKMTSRPGGTLRGLFKHSGGSAIHPPRKAEFRHRKAEPTVPVGSAFGWRRPMILSCVIGGIPGVVAKGFFRFSWRIREPYGCPTYFWVGAGFQSEAISSTASRAVRPTPMSVADPGPVQSP